jgi:hypothetical protein
VLRGVAFESTAGDNARRKNASHVFRRARLFAFVVRLNVENGEHAQRIGVILMM